MKTIYCFTNQINNKKYIGSTVLEPRKRYNQHIYNATNSNAHQYNYSLYLAMRKYGINNFEFSILHQEECTEERIREIEQEYIIKYNSLSPNGYNQTLDTKHPINDIASYRKMSETKRENAKEVAEVDKDNHILNKWRSIVDCAEDTGLAERKISACCRGEQKTTGGRIFMWIDKDNNLLIPQYIKNVTANYHGEKGTTQKQITNRKVAKINLETKEIIQIYDSIALAARENNCDNSAISKVCRGERHKCGGFGWKFMN